MAKVKIDILEKWDWLLGHLKSKTKKAKYARVLERIEQNNTKKYLKLLIPITYRVVTTLDEFKMTNSKKNTTYAFEFDEYEYFVDDVLIMDFAEKLVIEATEKILEKYKEIGVLGHLEIINSDNISYISIIH